MSDQSRTTLHLASNRPLTRRPSLAVVPANSLSAADSNSSKDTAKKFSCRPRHYCVQVRGSESLRDSEQHAAAAPLHHKEQPMQRSDKQPSQHKRQPHDPGQRQPRTRLEFLYGCRRPANG